MKFKDWNGLVAKVKLSSLMCRIAHVEMFVLLLQTTVCWANFVIDMKVLPDSVTSSPMQVDLKPGVHFMCRSRTCTMHFGPLLSEKRFLVGAASSWAHGDAEVFQCQGSHHGALSCSCSKSVVAHLLRGSLLVLVWWFLLCEVEASLLELNDCRNH